jgi:hypothetical protein
MYINKTEKINMKKKLKWFMDLTKDSSTETRRWEIFTLRANILLSWTGCLVAIIAVCGICFTSCTPTDRKASDIKLGEKISALKCGESINLMEGGEYNYLFKRFDYANGIVDLGGVNYHYQLSKKDGYLFYNLVGEDTAFYYQVKIYEHQATPAGGTVKSMEILKNSGQYHYCVTVGDFEITLIEIKGSVATIWVVNNSKKLFAYADMLPTQGIDPIWQQIKFSPQIHQTMNVSLGNRLILYEYIEDESGISLKEGCRIPYVGRLFEP